MDSSSARGPCSCLQRLCYGPSNFASVKNSPSELQWCSSVCARVCLVSSLWHGQVQFLSLRSLDGLRKWFALPLHCTSRPFRSSIHSLMSSLLHPSVHRFIHHPAPCLNHLYPRCVFLHCLPCSYRTHNPLAHITVVQHMVALLIILIWFHCCMCSAS